jgi:hypothetical protein
MLAPLGDANAIGIRLAAVGALFDDSMSRNAFFH